jgi:hypothetical protein
LIFRQMIADIEEEAEGEQSEKDAEAIAGFALWIQPKPTRDDSGFPPIHFLDPDRYPVPDDDGQDGDEEADAEYDDGAEPLDGDQQYEADEGDDEAEEEGAVDIGDDDYDDDDDYQEGAARRADRHALHPKLAASPPKSSAISDARVASKKPIGQPSGSSEASAPPLRSKRGPEPRVAAGVPAEAPTLAQLDGELNQDPNIENDDLKQATTSRSKRNQPLRDRSTRVNLVQKF